MPGGTLRRVGAGVATSEGGNRADLGDDGSGDDKASTSSAVYETGVTFGANVTGRAA